MLIDAGATVDARTLMRDTPLQTAIKADLVGCAEHLLDAGAKMSNLSKERALPGWFLFITSKRKRCRETCRVLYGVLRLRWRLLDGQRVPLDMIRVLTRLIWESRREREWGQTKPN